MRYSIIAAVAVAVMACAVPAFGHRGGDVSVEVVSDRSGSLGTIPHKAFRQSGTWVVKQYLEAHRGENYSIVVRNRLPERVGVVVAVDGRNIISGGTSSLGGSERMYILEPYGSATLEGWRTDLQSVNRFYFTDVPDSYAMRAFGDTSAMGVIAVAVFREKERPAIRHDRQPGSEKAAPSPSPSAGKAKRQASEAAGTGFGDKQYSPVVTVAFEAEPLPMEKVLIKYEWHEALCRKGVIACGPDRRNRLWDDSAFAPYPPGYGR